MKNKEIIDSIDKIYEKYRLPTNLQEHMLRATSVAQLICDHWIGPAINKENIILSVLLHDIGNIVKMDLKNKVGIDLLGKEKKRLDYWKKVKQEVIKKYGTDEHVVSEAIVKETGASKRILEIMENHVFKSNNAIIKSNDWDTKIVAYADQRTGPRGILSLQDRFQDIRERYGKRLFILAGPNPELLFDCGVEIEKQVITKTTLKKEEINDDTIKKYVSRWQKKLPHTFNS